MYSTLAQRRCTCSSVEAACQCGGAVPAVAEPLAGRNAGAADDHHHCAASTSSFTCAVVFVLQQHIRRPSDAPKNN